jgi:hypothetical protein
MARSRHFSRRDFLQASVAAPCGVPLAASLEEARLLAYNPQAAAAVTTPAVRSDRWMARIGKVSISRLICGGNLISGYAHARDLIYVSALLKNYYTPSRIMDTWDLCVEHGINTQIMFAGDPYAVDVYGKYRARGGKVQYLAQISPKPGDLKRAVTEAVDSGATGAFLVGNVADRWTREGAIGRVGEVVRLIKDAGLIAGVAGHELRVPQMCEASRVEPDFYVKTLHDQSYWSKQRPSQQHEVVDDRDDNFWCRTPEQVIGFMSEVERPWIAYKVLAAGAIHPKHGLRYAFQNGADFACVGMFDFQVAEDVAITHEVLASTATRDRPWFA